MPINAESLASGEADVTFKYNGETCTVTYRTSKLTKEYKARSLRFERESARISKRAEVLHAQVVNVSAGEGTDEARQEEDDAERAIEQLIEDDRSLKHNIDALVCEAVSAWDVRFKDGRMMPITVESLFPVELPFEVAILRAIGEHAQLGEVSGPNSQMTSPLPLRQRDEQESGPLSLNSTITSSHQNGAQP